MIEDIKKDHLIRSFLDSLYIEKGLSKNTVSSYKNDISSFFIWLNKKNIDKLKVTTLDLNNYISNLFNDGFKSSSINRKISSIKHFYLFLLKKKIIKNSPADEVSHQSKKNIYLLLCLKMRLNVC